MTRLYGNRLFLSPVELQPGDKVLDCGTGPGSWAFDLASTVPKSIQIFGIDVESSLFLPTPPENVTLSVASVYDLPKEWTGEFQLTHQRLLYASLTKDGWPIALRELFRVTKPNGWIELCEGNDKFICPQHEAHKGMLIFPRLFEATNHQFDIAHLLPELLRDAGFVDVQAVETDLPLGKWAGKDGENGCNNLITAFRSLKKIVLKTGVVESEEEYDELIDDLERIWNDTPGSKYKFHTIYGRKPLEVV